MKELPQEASPFIESGSGTSGLANKANPFRSTYSHSPTNARYPSMQGPLYILGFLENRLFSSTSLDAFTIDAL